MFEQIAHRLPINRKPESDVLSVCFEWKAILCTAMRFEPIFSYKNIIFQEVIAEIFTLSQLFSTSVLFILRQCSTNSLIVVRKINEAKSIGMSSMQ